MLIQKIPMRQGSGARQVQHSKESMLTGSMSLQRAVGCSFRDERTMHLEWTLRDRKKQQGGGFSSLLIAKYPDQGRGTKCSTKAS
jgi:hypothetical protein